MVFSLIIPPALLGARVMGSSPQGVQPWPCVLAALHWKKGLRIRRSKFCFASYCRRRINTEGKAKAAGWGTYLNAAQLHNYYHLSPRLIWRKVVGRILGGWWFGMVWGGWSSISFKASIPPSSYFLFILFFKSSWCKIASVARNKNQFCLPSSSDDLCLLFCLYPSSMYTSMHV